MARKPGGAKEGHGGVKEEEDHNSSIMHGGRIRSPPPPPTAHGGSGQGRRCRSTTSLLFHLPPLHFCLSGGANVGHTPRVPMQGRMKTDSY
jgi:hypothetical protein